MSATRWPWDGSGQAIRSPSASAITSAPPNGPAGARYASVAEAVRAAPVVVLATPWQAVSDALAAAGDLAGKVLIDCTNPLRMGADGLELEIGHTTSGGEHVASLAPGASVFKTLNQTGFANMEQAHEFARLPAVMYVAGDDAARKPLVMSLVSDLGFDAIDAGPLQHRPAAGTDGDAVDPHGASTVANQCRAHSL